MRRPLPGLLLAATLLASTALPARAEPPSPLPAAPLAPVAAPATAPPWAAPLAGTRRRSSGAMVGGIVLTSLGALAAAIGTAVYVDAASSCVQGTLSGQVFRSNCEQSTLQAPS